MCSSCDGVVPPLRHAIVSEITLDAGEPVTTPSDREVAVVCICPELHTVRSAPRGPKAKILLDLRGVDVVLRSTCEDVLYRFVVVHVEEEIGQIEKGPLEKLFSRLRIDP